MSTLNHFFYAKLDAAGDDKIEMMVDTLIQEVKNCRTAFDYVRALQGLGIEESDQSFLISAFNWRWTTDYYSFRMKCDFQCSQHSTGSLRIDRS
jgi:hypothetical protein